MRIAGVIANPLLFHETGTRVMGILRSGKEAVRMKTPVLSLLFFLWLAALGAAGNAWAQADRIDNAALDGFREHIDEAADAGDALDVLVRDFYRARGYRPLWQEEGRIPALSTELEALDGDGLRPADYRPAELVETWRRVEAAGDDSREWQLAELGATRRFLLALRHLHLGKVDPESVDDEWELPSARFEPDMAELSLLVEADDIDAAFESVRPPYPPYQRLREGLARYRAIEEAGGWPQLPARDSSLRPGDRHPDVAQLRKRLAVLGDPQLLAADTDAYDSVALESNEAEHYDRPLAEAVRRFQRRHLLEDDGVIGPRTRMALNVDAGTRVDQIRVNLERARWLLHDLPERFVLVDIAGYQLSYVRGPEEEDVWRTRIVVGQPYRTTPTLRSSITHLTLNPTWTIPPTIFREDMLPRIREDRDFLEEQNLSVIDEDGERLDPDEVDWDKPGNIMLRQPAGADNPLGRVVIRFPNDYAVYLHDTPAQHLFARPQRAVSSGCIRVENVMELVAMLLEDHPSWDADALRKALDSGDTGTIHLPDRVPVILHYWTVDPSRDGELAFRPDIYERDGDLRAALHRPLPMNFEQR